MARIMYGVHGTGRGHAMRALAVARHYPQHEFLFLSHGDGARLLRKHYPLLECPNPTTPVLSHKVATLPLLLQNIGVAQQGPRILERLAGVVDSFKPDVAITDYEFFVPRVCRKSGIPCLSLDHQHVITCGRHRVPASQWHSFAITYLLVRLAFSAATSHLVISFYRPHWTPQNSASRVLPPLLRPELLGRIPEDGEHVIAYQGYSTFPGFFPFLKTISRPVLVYGFNEDRREANLQFKRHSTRGFLEDLAGCSYVICGGGHTLISEALFYGKPVMSFPVVNAFEQFLNAHYIGRLGYGTGVTSVRPRPEIVTRFEERLPWFRRNIRTGHFFGNPEIFKLLDSFIGEKRLPDS